MSLSLQPDPILSLENVKVHIPIGKPGWFFSSQPHSTVKAVDGVSLEIFKGETIGLVGESGCGKSTLGRAILQLMRPTSGKVLFDGFDLTKMGLKSEELRRMRKRVQMIFQDPYASLNPRMTVEDIISEPLRTFDIASGEALRKKVQDTMTRVGLDPRYIRRYPHEFSGGQRQRIGIARAIALEPDFIVADEPISALDMSIQAQVMNLLKKLQKEMKLTFLFIAHDLSAVRHFCDRIAVMYLGKIVEVGDTETIIKNPKHPYTKALISAIPIPDPKIEKARTYQALEGEIPSPIAPPPGCTFHTRCPIKEHRCKVEVPSLINTNGHHLVSCHLV